MALVTDQARLDVRPVAGHLGAEIIGVDLSSPLDDQTIAEIRSALLRWRVLFFREQTLGHAEHIAFARRFGELTPGHVVWNGDQEFPEIYTLDRREQATQYGIATIDERQFHSDITPAVNPPLGSILRADVIPPYGGDTVWTNLVAAYAGLPEPLRRFADELRAVHRYGVDETDYTEGADARRARFAANRVVTEHPVVRVHPETGERALYVNPLFTSHIVGFSRSESRRVLDLFFEQLTRIEFTVRFRWEAGCVAFWDNRSTAHVGPVDLNHLDVDRRMHRVTLAGDVPVGPDGVLSRSIHGGEFGRPPI
jgi:taurine dioxygenase